MAKFQAIFQVMMMMLLMMERAVLELGIYVIKIYVYRHPNA